MDEENRKIYISGAEPQEDFRLEDILAEYGAAPGPGQLPDAEDLANRSRRIVLDNLDGAFSSAGFASLDDVIGDAVAEEAAAGAFQPREEVQDSFIPLPEPEPEPEPEELSTEQEVLIDVLQQEAEPKVEGLTDDDGSTRYAAPLEDAPEAAEKEKKYREKPEKKEKFLSPLVALMALIALRRGQRSKEEETREKAVSEDERPEMEPGKAVRYYGALRNHLRFRGRVAVGLSLVMIYLTYAAGSALPLSGALKTNPTALTMLLMILELSVVMCGLDIFTEGIMSLLRKKPGARTLVAVSCVFSMLDAILMGVTKLNGFGLPFCTVSAISMTFAVWGEFFRCSGLRTGFRVLTSSKSIYTVTGEKGLAAGEIALMKSRSSTRGFVRRSEGRDFGETVFGVLTPILLIAALVLSALASFAHGAPGSFFHCLSMLTAASAAFSATLCFAVPFAAAARCMARSGAAVAGWSGIREIGSSRHVVITDNDMFPKGTVEVGNIRILEGAFVDKVISYTGSVMAASGSGLAAPFADLIRRNGYTLSRVEGFEPHDGGGMTAVVNGDSVCVGNTGFMNLMGIRVPKKVSTHYSVYTAINGSLVGIFNMEYRATGSVQEALVTLLHSSLEAIFAIRDFNITPVMIKSKFRMPTEDFKFPAYAERYRISDTEPGENSRVAAVLAREGMGPLVDTAERGRRLFNGIRIGTAIAAAGCVFGMLLMFLLCWTKSFDNATAGNAVTFMLLWLIPTAVIVLGIQR